jgi:hypothetical protein
LTLAPRNPRLLAELEPFLVAAEHNRSRFDLSPFGVRVAESHCYDPLRSGSAPLLERLCLLDQAAFGAQSMTMPRWMFLDSGELSGGVLGFGQRAQSLSEPERARLGVDEAVKGLVPVSMYIAVPCFDRRSWVGHNLASAAQWAPEGWMRGLGSLTKALALKVFRAECQIGVVQWDNPALHVHTKIGPLEVLTAWTPAHSKPWTLTYRAQVRGAGLLHLAGDPAGRIPSIEPEFWLRSDDHAAMRSLQERIEAGEQFRVVGRPEDAAADVQRTPLAQA